MNYFTFDGSSSALNCGSPTVSGDCTVALRFNPTAFSGSTQIAFLSDNTPTTPRYAVWIGFSDPGAGAGNFEFAVAVGGSGAGSGSLGTVSSVFPTGTDAYVVFTRAGGVWTLYVNGTSQGTITQPTGTMNFDNCRLGAIDQGGNTAWVACKIAQFGIWSIAWSGGDIANHAAGKDPTSIEWFHAVQYQPLQVSSADVFGATISSVGSPGFSGTVSTIALSPSSVLQGSTTTITVTGTNTPWSTGSAAEVVSAGSAASDAVSTSTSRSFSFTAPSSGSSVTVTDPATLATATLALTAPAVAAANRGGSGRRTRKPSRLDFPLIRPPFKANSPARGGRL
jgi:Concanavalin A-like lectin/glucanases superfamily